MIAHSIVKDVGTEHKGYRADCSCRALSKILGIPYDECEALLFAETRYNPRRGGVVASDFRRLMTRGLGATFIPARIRLNSANAIDRLPKRAILSFTRHVAAYEDGVIFDSFQTTLVAGCKQTNGYYVFEN